MAKSFLKVKTGLLEPKHAKAMGIKVWLYLRMCEMAAGSGDAGEIPDWTDKKGAEVMQMTERAVRDQRTGLAAAGYITCEQGFRCMKVRIAKWVNPWSPWNGDTPGGRTGSHGDTLGVKKVTPPPHESVRPSYSKIKNLDTDGDEHARPRDLLFDSICEVCQVDPKTAGASVGTVKAALSKAGYTPEDVRKFGKRWKYSDPPTIWQLKERIGVVRLKGKGELDLDQVKSFKRMKHD